jgi:hypothetical protein
MENGGPAGSRTPERSVGKPAPGNQPRPEFAKDSRRAGTRRPPKAGLGYYHVPPPGHGLTALRWALTETPFPASVIEAAERLLGSNSVGGFIRLGGRCGLSRRRLRSFLKYLVVVLFLPAVGGRLRASFLRRPKVRIP